MLQRAIRGRCATLALAPSAYRALAADPVSPEFQRVIDAVTVVYTWFFRDHGQLAAVQRAIAEASTSSPVRVWVAGCATGEDAYSIALLAKQSTKPVRILGTDINGGALERARSACYPRSSNLRDVPEELKSQFRRTPEGNFSFDQQIRDQVAFARHNLVEPAPSFEGSARYDVIVCRNVLIYFRPQRALQVLEALVEALNAGGTLFLGAGEILYDVPAGAHVVYICNRIALRRGPAPQALPHHVPAPSPLGMGPVANGRPSHAPLSLVPPHPEGETPLPGSSRHDTPVPDDMGRGHRLLDEGRVLDALSAYRAAADNDPTSPDAQLYQGVAHYLNGELEPASHHFRAALFLDAMLWPAAFYLALAYESMGLLEDARREYLHLLRIGRNANVDFGRTHHPSVIGWHSDVMALAERRVREPKPSPFLTP